METPLRITYFATSITSLEEIDDMSPWRTVDH